MFYHKNFVFATNVLLFSLMSRYPKTTVGLSDRLDPNAPVLETSEDLQRTFAELMKHNESVVERLAQFYEATGSRRIIPLNLGAIRGSRTAGEWQHKVLDLTVDNDLLGFQALFFFTQKAKPARHQLTYTFRALTPWGDNPYYVHTEVGTKPINETTGDDLAFIGRSVLMNYGRGHQVLGEAERAAQNDSLNPGASAVRQYYESLAERQALPPKD